jgi:hypothetical protein
MARTSRLDIVVNSRAKGALKGLAGIGGALGGIARSAAVLGTGAAIGGLAAFGAGIRKISKDSISLGVQMDKVMKITGATERELAGLRVSALQEHTSFETLSTGLIFLSDAMEEAKRGTEQYADAFRELNINPKLIGDVSPIEMFKNIADEFQKLDSTSKKIQIGRDLFGRGGAELVPLLSMGSENLEKMQEEAEKAGLFMKGLAAQSKLIDDHFTTIKLKLEGLKLQAFSVFADDLQRAVEALSQIDFVSIGKGIGERIGPFIEDLTKLLVELREGKITPIDIIPGVRQIRNVGAVAGTTEQAQAFEAARNRGQDVFGASIEAFKVTVRQFGEILRDFVIETGSGEFSEGLR